VVLSISCNGVAEFSQLTNGVDSRTAGVGVRWFYACREDDIVGRLNLLEALAVDDMDGLRRQPPAMFSDNPFAGLAMPQDKRDAMSEEGEVVLLMAAEG
jgi:hypothetical protein